MRCVKTALIVVASVVMGACGGGSGCGMGAMADTTGWQVVDAGPFVFKLPPGYRDEFARGIDSYVGHWKAGQRSITFDWGPYTGDPRDHRGQPGAPRICNARIGGRNALVAEVRQAHESGGEVYLARGWWRGKREPPDGPLAHLSLGGSGPAADTAGRTQALTVIRTLRFRTRWTAQDSLRMRHRACDVMRAEVARMPEPYPLDAEKVRACPRGPAPPPPDCESVR